MFNQICLTLLSSFECRALCLNIQCIEYGNFIRCIVEAYLLRDPTPSIKKCISQKNRKILALSVIIYIFIDLEASAI